MAPLLVGMVISNVGAGMLIAHVGRYKAFAIGGFLAEVLGVHTGFPFGRYSYSDALGPSAGLRLQFLSWVAASPRTYAEAMDAWRTSCPRLSVWEDALETGWCGCRRGTRPRRESARCR